MSCQCEVTRKYAEKGIKMDEADVKAFYAHKSKEDAIYHALSSDIINNLDMDNDKLFMYLNFNYQKLAEVLTESNLFLIDLRNKYNCKDFQIDNDMLHPLIED